LEMSVIIHPVSFIRALSLALELTSTGLSQHHCRTAIIANKIGRHIGLPDSDQQTLTYAALLHDLGAAANWEEKHDLTHFAAGPNIHLHAEKGYELLNGSPQLGVLANPIRYHHYRFDGNNPKPLAGEDIPLLARIIFLADRIEILIREDMHIFDLREGILKIIEDESNRCFDPLLVKAFHELSVSESFWLDLVNTSFHNRFFQTLGFYGKMSFDADDMLHIAEIFAAVVDKTSCYTAVHSRITAEVSAYLAHLRGYSEEEVKLIRLAGLLHDLGKLAVPNSILDKPGPLTEKEFALVKQHPYYTLRILEQIDKFGLITYWASQHHEKLDCSGYPFALTAGSIRLGSRIISVADIFSALLETRPYRAGMTLEQVSNVMTGMVHDNKLDAGLVNDLLAHADEAYALIWPLLSSQGKPNP